MSIAITDCHKQNENDKMYIKSLEREISILNKDIIILNTNNNKIRSKSKSLIDSWEIERNNQIHYNDNIDNINDKYHHNYENKNDNNNNNHQQPPPSTHTVLNDLQNIKSQRNKIKTLTQQREQEFKKRVQEGEMLKSQWLKCLGEVDIKLSYNIEQREIIECSIENCYKNIENISNRITNEVSQ
jgi:hypothetical protein